MKGLENSPTWGTIQPFNGEETIDTQKDIPCCFQRCL
ncbi:unnamed protein product, partial [Brassica oleracea]